MIRLLNPSKYVVAVSGGVDSVVLLNMLVKQKGLQLIVAHYDHGIREDSKKDMEFVQNLANKYGLVFEYAEGHLGKNASEDTARRCRYAFLKKILNKYKADAIITAHHQDDVVETIIINLLRGTRRKGLSSLQNSSILIRPLLTLPKSEIIKYAQKNKLSWCEDSTNSSPDYLRNRVRLNIVPKFSDNQRQHLLHLQQQSININQEIDTILDKFIDDNILDRHIVILLPHELAKELIAHWLRRNGLSDFNAKLVEKLTIDSKILMNNKKSFINKSNYIIVTADEIQLRKINESKKDD